MTGGVSVIVVDYDAGVADESCRQLLRTHLGSNDMGVPSGPVILMSTMPFCDIRSKRASARRMTSFLVEHPSRLTSSSSRRNASSDMSNSIRLRTIKAP